MMNDEYEHFGVKTNNSLMHSRGPWKKHKYISKGPNGYVYAHEPSNRVRSSVSGSDESWADRFDRKMRNLKATSAANSLAKGISNIKRSKRRGKRFANTMNNIEKVADRLYNDSEEAKWEKRYDKRKKRQKAGKIINGIDRALPKLGKQSRHNKAKNKLAAEKALVSAYNKLRNRVLENQYKPNSGQNIAKELQDLNEIIRLSNSKILERAIYGDDE